MQPKIKNATFATQCNPYQNMRYNSEKLLVLSNREFFSYIRLSASDIAPQ